jgi:hypothetical protein
MKAWSRAVLGAVGLLACAGCDNPTGFDPHTFYLCVHEAGATVEISNPECGFPSVTVHRGQSVTFVVETFNVRGPQRTAQLALPAGGSPGPGLSVSLGPATVAIPGTSSLTIAVAAGAPVASMVDMPLTAQVSTDDRAQVTVRILIPS